MAPEIWWAQLSTWRGTSIGATHWYVKLRRGHGGRAMDIDRILTATEARQETKKDDRYTYKAGDWKKGWCTPETAKEAAITAFHELASEGDVLVLGDGMGAPDEALAGPTRVVEAISALDRDDWEGFVTIVEKFGLVDRDGPNVFGHGAPPWDPDLPYALVVAIKGKKVLLDE